MNPESTISIAMIISIVSISLAIIGAIRNRKNDEEGARRREAERLTAENNRQLAIEKNFVQVNAKLDNFSSVTKEMMHDNAEKTSELKDLTKQMITVNNKVDTLFKYNEDHELRLKDLEHQNN